MKQLIKGTAVIMDGETIENVLIGEPSADGRSVTLGIPKGDAHVWSDKIVRFFGRNYRTKGLPEQGIEELSLFAGIRRSELNCSISPAALRYTKTKHSGGTSLRTCFFAT